MRNDCRPIPNLKSEIPNLKPEIPNLKSEIPPQTIEQAYRVAERVATFTFMDCQLPDGGWPLMHYPLDERIPEMALSYRPLKHTLAVPPYPIVTPGIAGGSRPDRG